MPSQAGSAEEVLPQEAEPTSQEQCLTLEARAADKPNLSLAWSPWGLGPRTGPTASMLGYALLRHFRARSLLKGRLRGRPVKQHVGTASMQAARSEKSCHCPVLGHLGFSHSPFDTLTCVPTGPRPLPSGPASPKRKLEAAEEPPGEELSKRARVAELPAPELPSRDV